MAARELVERKLAHDDSIHTITFLHNPHNKDKDTLLIASAGIDATVKVWKLDLNAPALTSPLHTVQAVDGIACIQIIQAPIITAGGALTDANAKSDPPLLCWSSWMDGSVRVFDALSGVWQCAVTCGAGEVWSIAAHPTSPVLAAGSAQGNINVYNTQALLSALNTSNTPAAAVTTLATAMTKTKQIWATDTAITSSSSSSSSAGFIISLCFSPSGSLLAAGHTAGHVTLFNTQTGKLIATLTNHALQTPVRALVFSADSSTLWSGADDGQLIGYDVHSLQAIQQIKAHQSWITALALPSSAAAAASQSQSQPQSLLPQKQLLVSASADRRIKVWDLSTYECIHQFEHNTASVWSISSSTTAQRILVSGAEDASIHVFQLPAV